MSSRIFEPHIISVSGVEEALEHFLSLSHDNMTDGVFRGHNDADWLLSSSLDRFGMGTEQYKVLGGKGAGYRDPGHLQHYLDTFRGHYNALVDSRDVSDDELWQIAQHHGLPSPLLDVSKSPLVALFFALFNKNPEDGKSACIWQFDVKLLRVINHHIQVFLDDLDQNDGLRVRLGTVDYLAGHSTYSPRQYAQQGGFIRWKFFRDLPLAIKYWQTVKAFVHTVSDRPLMQKVEFPIDKISLIGMFRKLNSMNIAPRSLFPDINGAAEQAKMDYLLRISVESSRSYLLSQPS